MAWAIMCCGCMKVMDQAGKASIQFAAHGVLSLPEVGDILKQAADFPDKAHADARAKESGWSVIDGDHRCPACTERYDPDPPRRGAYIEIPPR